MAPGQWFDEAAGPVVRPYAVTRGRTRPTRTDFDLIAIITATDSVIPDWHTLGPEHTEILQRCRTPLSVAEIVSETRLLLGVVRVLLGDLLDHGLISVRRPAPVTQLPHEHVLKEVIDGLHAL